MKKHPINTTGGKGSAQRSVDATKYSEGYDRIFAKPKDKATSNAKPAA